MQFKAAYIILPRSPLNPEIIGNVRLPWNLYRAILQKGHSIPMKWAPATLNTKSK